MSKHTPESTTHHACAEKMSINAKCCACTNHECKPTSVPSNSHKPTCAKQIGLPCACNQTSCSKNKSERLATMCSECSFEEGHSRACSHFVEPKPPEAEVKRTVDWSYNEDPTNFTISPNTETQEGWESRFEEKISCSELFDVEGNDLTLEIKNFIAKERLLAVEEERKMWSERIKGALEVIKKWNDEEEMICAENVVGILESLK